MRDPNEPHIGKYRFVKVNNEHIEREREKEASFCDFRLLAKEILPKLN